MGTPNQLPGGEVRHLPALSPLGLPPLKGRWMAVGGARMCLLGVVVSSKGYRCFRRHSRLVVSPSLSPHSVGRALPNRRRVAHRAAQLRGVGGCNLALVNLASKLFDCGSL
ncbi:hypothetical protein PVAP13_5NG112116 [Panicum virgatum]|uniref:Uncharacterized protein n=1 Tax=Panicum virgatum TaxID=38727 RepID=A0A8T0S5M7_PANVG|nr:hypothetical protein PVAP13_5NG112116 [Panicum virgatum]